MKRINGHKQEPAICGVTLTVGKVDPSSTECDLHPGHVGKHEGNDPLGASDMRVSWYGGGKVAGDLLPISQVECFARPLTTTTVEQGLA